MWLPIYGLVITALGFGLMGYDKRQAVKHGRRIPEMTFFALAIIGGATGIWFGMQRFRHKTQHLSFQLGIPLLMASHAFVIFKQFT